MGLPSDQEIKDYLKVETDEENTLIMNLNYAAQAWVTRYLGVPLTSDSRTFRGRFPRKGYRRERYEQLTVPVIPCDTSAVITDETTGDAVDSDLYEIDPRKGLINAVYGEAFSAVPYSIAIGIGWSYDPDLTTVSEPILRQAIMWAATDYYRRRNSAAEYEQSGGQVSITYSKDEVPKVLRGLLESLRPKGRAW